MLTMKSFKFILASILGLIAFFCFDALTVPHDKFGAPNPPKLWPYPGVRQSLLSLSPNNLYRVLVEYSAGPWGSDKGITVWLQTEENAELIVKLGIRGEIGSERIIWSHDGDKFLLVGRHFIKSTPEIPEHAITQLNEIIYLLYDVKSQKNYCIEGIFKSKACLPLTKDLLEKFK
jgi:hypothetical protein